MTSEKLQKAREFEKRYLGIPDRNTPGFHLTGGIGWINDPNGFSVFRGEYHLFFQYYPYDLKWGPMHWGHVKTSDFIRWERLPAAMAPDQEYDEGGCFSGSAVETPDGRHLLMYTGVRGARNADGIPESFQTQCIAVGNGIDYEKYAGNPVIRAEDVPEGGSVHDFRDPKIWYEDGLYRAVMGNRPADGSGAVLLYESKDAVHWSYVTTVDASENKFGRMWECPDFFGLDGKTVLLVSPQDMMPDGLEFHPGNISLSLIGTWDPEEKRLKRENVHTIDYGTDFYAAQTVLSTDGRRIMIGWMQNWETSAARPPELRFAGQMSLPRELSVRDGRLCQNPVRELERYRGKKTVYADVPVRERAGLKGIGGRCLDLSVTVRPERGQDGLGVFRMYVAGDDRYSTLIRYRAEAGTIKVDRTHSGFPHDIVNIREFPVGKDLKELRLRLILDRYSLELFVNDGAQAASFVIYTGEEAEGISFFSEDGVRIDVEQYELCGRPEDAGQ